VVTTKRAPRRALGALAWLSIAAMLGGLSGCGTGRDDDPDLGRVEPRGGPALEDDVVLRPAAYETGRAGSAMGLNTTTQTIDGVLRISKSMPRQVTAGEMFEYDITVENTSDLMLSEFWLREHDAGGMPSLGEPSGMVGAGQMQPRKLNQPGRGQAQTPTVRDRQEPILRPVGQVGAAGEMQEPMIRPANQRLNQAGGTSLQPRQSPAAGATRQPGTFGAQQWRDATPSGNQGALAGGGDNVREIQVGTLMPGQSKTVTTTASVETAGEYMICTSVAYTPLVCATGVAIKPELTLTKVGPEFASIGQPITYNLTVSNTGIGAAQNVRLVDPLPGQMRTTEGLAETSFDVGTLNAGQSRSFTVTAVPPEPGRYVNIARATSASGLEARAEAVTVVRAPQLTIEKFGPEQQYSNINTTYEITVTNTGDAPAQNVVVEDLMPPGARFIEASANGNASENQVTWNLGTLAPGQSRTVTTTMIAPSAGTFENCAIARSSALPAVRDCVTTRFAGVAALLLEMVDIQDPVLVGGETVYTITVINQGTAPANAVGMSIELDPAHELVNARGASPFQPSDAGLTFAPIPTLAPGAEANFEVRVRATAPGDLRLRVALTADELTQPVVEAESTQVVESQTAPAPAPAPAP
jgi:uncharacterized repeat protein (TIGR01451 family)